MYYEERYVRDWGNWYYRHTPKGEWLPFTVEMLCRKIEQMQALLPAVSEPV